VIQHEKVDATELRVKERGHHEQFEDCSSWE